MCVLIQMNFVAVHEGICHSRATNAKQRFAATLNSAPRGMAETGFSRNETGVCFLNAGLFALIFIQALTKIWKKNFDI